MLDGLLGPGGILSQINDFESHTHMDSWKPTQTNDGVQYRGKLPDGATLDDLKVHVHGHRMELTEKVKDHSEEEKAEHEEDKAQAEEKAGKDMEEKSKAGDEGGMEEMHSLRDGLSSETRMFRLPFAPDGDDAVTLKIDDATGEALIDVKRPAGGQERQGLGGHHHPGLSALFGGIHPQGHHPGMQGHLSVGGGNADLGPALQGLLSFGANAIKNHMHPHHVPAAIANHEAHNDGHASEGDNSALSKPEGAAHQESPFGIILDALSKAAEEGGQAPAAPTKEGGKPDSEPNGADEKPASPALS